MPGVETVLDEQGNQTLGLAHERSGELIALAKPESWFSYYYWLDDARASDFARTVDIYRKLGYDPVELFMNPKLSFPNLSVLWRLLKKRCGLRVLMDVIPLDTNLVKGSHGRITDNIKHGPVFISSESGLLPVDLVAATDVKQLILDHVFKQ